MSERSKGWTPDDQRPDGGLTQEDGSAGDARWEPRDQAVAQQHADPGQQAASTGVGAGTSTSVGDGQGGPGTVEPARGPVDGRGSTPVRIGRVFLRGFREKDFLGLSAEMAYRFLFALFPFAIFLVALSGFAASAFDVANPADQIVSNLSDSIPAPVADALRPQLEQITGTRNGGLLSLGALLALWAATGGTNTLVKAMHRAYDIDDHRPFVMRYAVAVGLTFLGAVGILLSFTVIVGGVLMTQHAASMVGVSGAAWSAIQILRWPAVLAVLVIATAVVYRFAPDVVAPWRWILLGATVFALGWLLTTAGFGVYVSDFSDYGATYGSIGGVIVLLLWLYITALLLILGAQLTAAVARVVSPGELRGRHEGRLIAEVEEDVKRGLGRGIRSIKGDAKG
jgi:membrane protein